MKKFLPVVLIFELIMLSAPALAYERGLVKGETDVVVVENFKISEGPGFFLPSSPLYQLDLFVNSLKIKLAGSPSEEVRRRGSVAAERLAELKIALEANNPKGIDTALSNLTEHLDGIKTVFVKEKASGRDVLKLAEEMYAKLETDDEALMSLIAVSEEVMAKKLEAVLISLSQAEDSVIEAMPDLTRERQMMKKLTKDTVKTTKEAEKQVSKANADAKQALKVANKSLIMRFGDEGFSSMILDDAVLRPYEESIEQSEKALEEANKALEKALRAEEYDIEKAASPSGSDVIE